jgi:hypothetical protein
VGRRKIYNDHTATGRIFPAQSADDSFFGVKMWQLRFPEVPPRNQEPEILLSKFNGRLSEWRKRAIPAIGAAAARPFTRLKREDLRHLRPTPYATVSILLGRPAAT